MFTWICPRCGREVPPSYSECPDCARKDSAPLPEPSPTIPAPAEPPAVVAPPPPPPPARPSPSSRHGLPTWLLSILFAFAFIGVGLGAYWGLEYFRSRPAASPAAAARKPAPQGNVLQKFIEVSGIRLIQDAKQRTQVRFLVVNHSPAEIVDLGASVMVWGRTAKSDEEPVGSFSFSLPALGPWESKELTASLDSKLRVYEMPDWQNINTEVRITSPQ